MNGETPTPDPSKLLEAFLASGGNQRAFAAMVGAGGLEHSDGASLIAYNPKTRAIGEESFKEVEWSKAQAKASFTMHLDAGRSLRFAAEADASNDKEVFRSYGSDPLRRSEARRAQS